MSLSFAGLTLDRPHLMGILNVTPDSFFDGGRHVDPVAFGLRLVEEGASIVDVGGESTRPGATPVDPQEEQRRVLPVIEARAARDVLVRVDTRNASTMRAALAAGARMVNDVSGLTHDAEAVQAVARSRASVVLMHMRGTPQDMLTRTGYADVVEEVAGWLERRVLACERAGIGRDRIAIDPVGAQLFERSGNRRLGLGRDPLPVLGQVREHREEHETAHEGDRVVEAQRVEPRIDRLGPGNPAVPVDARRADIFGLPEQLLAAIGADDVAENPPEIADVGILRDLDRRSHGRLCCTCEGAASSRA